MLSIIVVWNNNNGVHDSWKNGQRWTPNPEDTLSMRVMKAVALTTSGKSFGQTLMRAVFFKGLLYEQGLPQSHVRQETIPMKTQLQTEP